VFTTVSPATGSCRASRYEVPKDPPAAAKRRAAAKLCPASRQKPAADSGLRAIADVNSPGKPSDTELSRRSRVAHLSLPLRSHGATLRFRASDHTDSLCFACPPET